MNIINKKCYLILRKHFMSRQIKMVLLGQSSTGKTSIMYRLLHDSFTSDSESTIGASFATMKNDNIIYQIWDTAGQERYNSMIPMYSRNAEIVIFVFDLSDYTTINRFDTYMKELRELLDDNFKVIIVGNKMDLFKGNLETVHTLINDKLNSYDKLKGRIAYVNVSAKDGINFEQLKNKITTFGAQIREQTNLKNEKEITILIDTVPKSTNCTC